MNHPTTQPQAFQGRGGRAFLLDTVVNVALAPPEDRLLMTGVHTVADVVCAGCRALLGWKYVRSIVLYVVDRVLYGAKDVYCSVYFVCRWGWGFLHVRLASVVVVIGVGVPTSHRAH